MRLAIRDLDYLGHMWRMIDAEEVRDVKNGKVGEKVLRHGNLCYSVVNSYREEKERVAHQCGQ